MCYRLFGCLSSNVNVFSRRGNIPVGDNTSSITTSDDILLDDSTSCGLAILYTDCSLLTKEDIEWHMTNVTTIN